MNPLLSLIAEQEKKFDEQFPKKKAVELPGNRSKIKSFNRSSLIKLLEANVERLKAQMKNQLLPVTRKMSRKSSKQLQRESYNAALDQEIQTYQEAIDQLKK